MKNKGFFFISFTNASSKSKLVSPLKFCKVKMTYQRNMRSRDIHIMNKIINYKFQNMSNFMKEVETYFLSLSIRTKQQRRIQLLEK